MKKIIMLLVIMIFLVIGGVFVLRNTGSDDKVINEIDEGVAEVIEVIEPEPEIRIKSFTSDITIEISEEEVAYIRNENLVQLEYLNELYRFVYQYDEDNNQLIWVYEDQTYLFNFNSNQYSINGKESYNNDILVKKGNVIYVSLEVLQKQFNMSYFLIEDPLFSLQIDFNSKGEKTYLIQEIINGIKDSMPEKITMTWEAVYSRKTDVSSLYDMPGLDVISPVWYEVVDSEGQLRLKTQDDYIQWALDKDYDLWPAVTNSFDPDMTRDIISSIEIRTNVIDQLVKVYSENEFEGINIDFENIYKDDKEKLSQFIAELTAAFHRSGMLVSMDVTFGGGSDNWSKCYDRKVLGEWVDYIVVMSYDEHWGSSPISGSVASLNWLDKNLEILISEVDSNKVIMGIPFYMRVWFERPHKELVNQMKVTSDAITMYKMESILAGGDYNVLWDEAAGQNYISFIDATDNAVKKVWIEDAESLKLKIKMVHKYNLKGIASWRRGYELESIWPVLEEALEKGE